MRTFGELEERIMAAVWARSTPVTVRDIVDELAATKPAAYTTVITVVERLRAKAGSDGERDGRSYLYFPTRSRHEYVADLMGSVLDESDDRSAALLSFAGQLDPDDAVSLRLALDDLNDQLRR